jgi:predicted transcriptional regulator
MFGRISMATTSIHVSEQLLAALDAAARARGISRNRLIVEACEREVGGRREWPADFFDDGRLTSEDLDELRRASDFTASILEARRNRVDSPL